MDLFCETRNLSTTYGRIDEIHHIYFWTNLSNHDIYLQSCVMVSQPLQKVTADVHDVQLSTADNTFHIYGICLNRSRMIQTTLPKREDAHSPNMVGWFNRHLNNILFKRSF